MTDAAELVKLADELDRLPSYGGYVAGFSSTQRKRITATIRLAAQQDNPSGVVYCECVSLEVCKARGCQSRKLPAIPDDDADFTPDLARKIIAKYQQMIAAQQDVGAKVLNELKALHLKTGWQSTYDLIRSLEQSLGKPL